MLCHAGLPLGLAAFCHEGELIQYEQAELSKAQWKKASAYDMGGTRLSACKRYRFRTTSAHRIPGYKPPEGLDSNHEHRSVCVYLTDSKAHPRPLVCETVCELSRTDPNAEEQKWP